MVARLGLRDHRSSLLTVTLFRHYANEAPDEVQARVLDTDLPLSVRLAAIEAQAVSGDYRLVPAIVELGLRAPDDSEELPRYLHALGRIGHPAARRDAVLAGSRQQFDARARRRCRRGEARLRFLKAPISWRACSTRAGMVGTFPLGRSIAPAGRHRHRPPAGSSGIGRRTSPRGGGSDAGGTGSCAVISAPDWLFRAAEIVTLFVIACGLIQILFYIVRLLFAALALHRRPAHASTSALWDSLWRYRALDRHRRPAYNEEVTIIRERRGAARAHYPDFEVIVVNDGSRRMRRSRPDRPLFDAARRPLSRSRACASADPRLYAAPDQPRLFLVDKQNGGKADAMNAGINVARTPLVCVIDADTLLEPDALMRAVRPFIDDPARTVAVGERSASPTAAASKGDAWSKRACPATSSP